MAKLDDMSASLSGTTVDILHTTDQHTFVPLDLVYSNMSAVRAALRADGFVLDFDDGNPGSIIYSAALKVRILEDIGYPAYPGAGSDSGPYTELPQFTGSDIADMAMSESVAITAFDASVYFKAGIGGDNVYTAADLPAGVTMDADTGVLSGDPDVGQNASSPFTAQVTLTTNSGAALSNEFAITVAA